MTSLTPAEIRRYGRHFSLPQVGVKGQEKLKRASVLLVGAGGLGSPLALYLAAAGVGVIGIADFDVVDESNLQRQVLHGTAMLGQPKLASAVQRLRDLNPHVRVVRHDLRLAAANAPDIFARYDVIADGADNFPTRYLVNDAAVLAGKPLVSGAIQGFLGQLAVFNYRDGPCYRCLFPDMPPAGSVPSCAEGGVLGALPGVIGSLQAVEVMKILLEIGDAASGTLLLYDALKLSFDRLQISKNPDCAACGPDRGLRPLHDPDDSCAAGPAGAGAPTAAVPEITPGALQDGCAGVTLIDVREAYERDICVIDGALPIPLGELEAACPRLDRQARIVVYCKGGARSRQAARLLMEQGFTRVHSLAGGILAWIDDVEPGKPKY